MKLDNYGTMAAYFYIPVLHMFIGTQMRFSDNVEKPLCNSVNLLHI